LHVSLQRLGFPTVWGWTQHQAPAPLIGSLCASYLLHAQAS
jgi:hypothetical protein